MTCLTSIALAGGLDDEEKVEAIEAGPEHITAAPGHPELRSRAEFSQGASGDLTDGYLETLRA